MTNEQFAARLQNLVDAALARGPGLNAIVNETAGVIVDVAFLKASDPSAMIEQTIASMRHRATADAD